MRSPIFVTGPLLLIACVTFACSDPGETTTEATTTGTSAGPTGSETSTSGGETTTDTDDPTAISSTTASDECMVNNCKVDRDHDSVSFACDNSPDFYNPSQTDIDGDGFGDVNDLCPTIAAVQNTADSDRDGVGNDCDVCRRTLNDYNNNEEIPFFLRVRNNPSQQDSDRDGIGDACDNCVRVANCQGYGEGDGLTPHEVGAPLDDEGPDCQADANANGIGDACEGQMSPEAAGPVGFGPDDDFDQDGLSNIQDYCPRLYVAPQSCQSDADCPASAPCTPAGVCNHVDSDGDAVGDVCDTCLVQPNPMQIVEGGAQADDPDSDFIGNMCEQNVACEERRNPRLHAYYDVHVNGRCCATLYDIFGASGIHDPFGQPLDILAIHSGPPGASELPPGCAEALAQTPDGVANPITLEDVASPAALRPYLCMLAAPDQDFDGVPDSCDLCPHSFDPDQEIYIDPNDKEWPDLGKYCNGEYAPETWDPANSCWPSP